MIALAIIGGWLAKSGAVAQSPDSPEQPPSIQSAANLLVNGSFDDPAYPFYWRYPNHFIAGGWTRWWIHGSVLPEYDDVRPSRPYHYDGDHAQVYFKWGNTYTAGIYQVVTGLTPCVPYRLTAWARNHSLASALPHARIGLDPQGTQLTPDTYDCAVKTGLPPLTVWSQEQTNLFVWEQLSVEAEPLGDRLTAIFYASPWRPNDGLTYYFDTFWDAASLTEVGFPNNRLPAPPTSVPSGFIANVITSTVLDLLMIEWDTPEPASTQVWYKLLTTTVSVTPTGTSATYPSPVIQQGLLDYPLATSIDTMPVTHHRAFIHGLSEGDQIEFIALSRRPLSNTCTTEVSAPLQATMGPIPPILRVYLPLAIKGR